MVGLLTLLARGSAVVGYIPCVRIAFIPLDLLPRLDDPLGAFLSSRTDRILTTVDFGCIAVLLSTIS